MGTSASSVAASPIDELNYTLDDLKTADAFNLKHRRIYDEFFKEEWYRDETKLKAVLFSIMFYFNGNIKYTLSFEKYGFIFNVFGTNRKDEVSEREFFPIYKYIEDLNRRFLVLKYIEQTEFENIEQLKEKIPLITNEELFNSSFCREVFRNDKMKIIDLIKMYYVFSVLKDHDLFRVEEFGWLILSKENKDIFFNYILFVNTDFYNSIWFNIKNFLQDFKIEDIVVN